MALILPMAYDVSPKIAGTPVCFTIDGQTKEDGTVTARNRDDASQERIDKTRCMEFLRDKLAVGD